MTEVAPPLAAQRMATIRLNVDRLAAPYGDPAADEALSRDVAGEAAAAPGEPSTRYLEARTRFIDRVLVNAMDRQISQVVLCGASYDGRALRYAKPGVRWWEVDRADDQAGKRERLRRLGIDSSHVTYIAGDLEAAGLADSLLASGFEPDAPALFLCEDAALRLSRAGLCAMLSEFRSLATPGTRVSLCLPPAAAAAVDGESPDRLGGAQIGPDGAPGGEGTADLVGRSRWRPVEMPERAQRAGFMVAAPVWAPAPESPSLGRIARFAERMLYRPDAYTLAGHIEDTYGVTVVRTRELDLGVNKVDLAGGATWIARVFPSARAEGAVRDDARLLDWLAAEGFPAERCATPDPVFVHEGQSVLVTEFTAGTAPSGPDSSELLGSLLGRLHSLPTDSPEAQRPGGAWHHLVLDSSPADEVPALAALMHDARHRVPAGERRRYDVLCAAVDSLDGCADLPQAFVHPDFAPANVISTSDGELVVIDWAGSGRGPRIVSLGCLLWATRDKPSIAKVIAGYREFATLEQAELDRLLPAMRLRPLVLACWMFATGRGNIRAAADRWEQQRRRVEVLAEHARTVFDSGS